MSVEEIKYALEHRQTIDPDFVNESDLDQAGCLIRVCVLPENITERFQYLGDALVQMVRQSVKDDDLRICIGQLAQSLSYMINSASWRENTLHQFDRDELKRKLRAFLR